jgi:DNA-binding CsgD family transcriptional regulator
MKGRKEGYHWFRRWRPSSAQRRVLEELLAGGSNAEIATRLGISADGVKWHLSQLLAEAELDDRQALAEWWSAQRLQPQPAFALLRRFWPAATAVVGIVAIAALVLLVQLPKTQHDDASGSSRGAASGPPSTANIAPPPTPTRAPVSGGALVFDTRDRSVRALPNLVYYRQWLDSTAMTFVALGSESLPVVVSATGETLARVSDRSGLDWFYAMPGEGKILMARLVSGKLGIFDVATGREQQIGDFGPPPPGLPSGRVSAISVTGRRIAFAEGSPPGAEVEVYALDGSAQRVVYRARADEQAVFLAWSPDGTRLVVQLAPRGAGNQIADHFVVVALDGRVLLESSSTAVWAGNPRLLVTEPVRNPGSASSMASDLMDLVTGARTPVSGTTKLICVSPEGRYAVSYSIRAGGPGPGTGAVYQLRDVVTDELLVEATTEYAMTACDWTRDGTMAVVSPGGK